MKNIILFDTSIGTTNKGDDIIMESTKRGLKPVLDGNYVVHIPTHITPFSAFQTHFWWKAKWVQNADYKFICGTDLLATDLMCPTNDLNVNLLNCRPLCNSVLVGVGNSRLNKRTNWYTRRLYNKVLSNEFIHCTRDDETRAMLENLGFRAVTTGCPTLWGLTPEHCKEIPQTKADEVVFTLTGVQRDPVRDQLMLDILKKNYKKRHFYVQTIWDMDYFNTLDGVEDVAILAPSLESYAELLDNTDIDYVGTRLHGGVYAMQRKKRAIIMTIDNRARNMSKVNNLNVVEREHIDRLEATIRSSIKTEVRVDFAKLEKWMTQFL